MYKMSEALSKYCKKTLSSNSNDLKPFKKAKYFLGMPEVQGNQLNVYFFMYDKAGTQPLSADITLYYVDQHTNNIDDVVESLKMARKRLYARSYMSKRRQTEKLTESEKERQRKLNRIRVNRYNAKQKKKLAEDKDAARRQTINGAFSASKTYIRHYSNLDTLEQLQVLIAKRKAELLNENEKDNQNNF